jgi:hypothetical protein
MGKMLTGSSVTLRECSIISNGKGGTSMVLRDANGVFVRAIAKWYDHYLDALNTEAMA